MTSDTYSLNADLTFHDATGKPIAVELLEVAIEREGNLLAVCRLNFAVAPSLYGYLASQEAFNNREDFRSDGWQRGFADDRPVEMEVKIAPDLLIQLLPHAQSAETIADYLLGLGMDDELLKSENWYALNVKQLVPLPPEFGSATLKEGYSTEWANF
jgi:hypothetical protein